MAGQRPSPVAVHSNRILTQAAVAEIQAIMARRKMKPGEVMKEMGFKSLNASLPRALERGTKLQPAVLAALEDWIKSNATP